MKSSKASTIAIALLIAAAEAAAQQPPQKAPSDGAALAQSLSNLGAVLRDLGKPDEARSLFERALAIRKKALPPDHPDLARALDNLAALLQEPGKLDEARPLFEQALAIRRKVLPPGHPDLAESLSYLGGLLQRLGKAADARACYEQALAILKTAVPADHPHVARAHENLGHLLAAQGQTGQAWRALAAAAEAHTRYAARLVAASATSDHGALLRQGRTSLDALLNLAIRDPKLDPARLEELFNLVHDSRALSTRSLAARHRAMTSAAEALQQLRDLRRRLAEPLLAPDGKLSAEEQRAKYQELQRQIDDIEREQGQGLNPGGRPAGAGEVAARLAEGTVLIELVRYRPRDFEKAAWGAETYAAMLLWRGDKKGGQQARLAELGPAKAIDEAVRAWRAAAQTGQIKEKADRELRERVWAPLGKALPEKTTRLVIAPDGDLNLLPFGAIRLADGKYLVESYAVHYVSTGRDLMPMPAAKKSDLAVVVADPFRRLASSAREADAVVMLLKGTPGWRPVVHRGAAATEEALVAVKRPRLLYVATQGAYLADAKAAADPRLPNFGEDPRLRSLVALAGANKWRERSAKGLSDGLLTALEVEGLDLWGTELVVLSASESGLGEIVVGEGVLGLRRAFQLAGAQSVIASLWMVPDHETAHLMPDCLQRWLKGAPPDDALRAAQLEMIRRLRAGPERGRREAPPLYWAGFVCHGGSR